MKKRGKRINQGLALRPLGVKSTRYELDARAALLAIERGCAKEQHFIDLYVLADLCETIGCELHVFAHCGTVKRLCEVGHQNDYKLDAMGAVGMAASVGVLLDYFKEQPNAKIAKAAIGMIAKMDSVARNRTL